MKENTKTMVGVIVAFTALLVLLLGFGSQLSLYVVVVAVILIAVVTRDSDINYLTGSFSPSGKKEEGGLDEREKKLLIFHILTLLERRKTIDMAEIATELDVSIYALNDLVRFLDKHKVVEVIYPPMKNLPVIREGDSKKSRRLRKQIYRSVAKKNLLGKPMKEDFTREVEEYLQSMRRDLKS